MNDFSDFSDEDLEITELPERDEMLMLPFGLGTLGLTLTIGL
jgi:hypothetical protein